MSVLPILFWFIAITNVAIVHCIELVTPIQPLPTTQVAPSTSPKLIIKPDLFSSEVNSNVTRSNPAPKALPIGPFQKLGEKRYYLGIYFKANWYKAAEFCRYHSMHLASITSQEENDEIERKIRKFGLANERFWTSGNDLGHQGTYYWSSIGEPVTFTKWYAGDPNNVKYSNGDVEHCLEILDRDGKGFRWNDHVCSLERYFVCEV